MIWENDIEETFQALSKSVFALRLGCRMIELFGREGALYALTLLEEKSKQEKRRVEKEIRVPARAADRSTWLGSN